jgi:hypothetical protein
MSVPAGSIEIYSGPESTVGNVYSLKVFVLGKKMNTLFVANSTPKSAIEPEIVVAAKPVIDEPGVGIAHSLNVFVDGSSCATLLPDNSTNQQQFPEGSNVNPVGVLLGVGIVHSVSVAAVVGA